MSPLLSPAADAAFYGYELTEQKQSQGLAKVAIFMPSKEHVVTDTVSASQELV